MPLLLLLSPPPLSFADDYRIFVGDLGNEVTDETLTQAFRQFRSFNKAKIIRERWNNKTKGYGFVSFADSADMVACMKSMNGKPDDKPLPSVRSPCVVWWLISDFVSLRFTHRQVHWQSTLQTAQIDVGRAFDHRWQNDGAEQEKPRQQAHEQALQGHYDTLSSEC